MCHHAGETCPCQQKSATFSCRANMSPTLYNQAWHHLCTCSAPALHPICTTSVPPTSLYFSGYTTTSCSAASPLHLQHLCTTFVSCSAPLLYLFAPAPVVHPHNQLLLNLSISTHSAHLHPLLCTCAQRWDKVKVSFES